MTPDAFKQMRKEAGLTQAEMAEKLGVSRKTVVNWEGGTFAIPDKFAYHGQPATQFTPDLSRAANDAEGYRRLREHWGYPNHATVMEYKRMEGYFWAPEAFKIIAQLYPDVLTDPGEIDWAVLERTVDYIWRNPNFGGFRGPLLDAFHAKYGDNPKGKFPNGFAIVDNQLCFISERKGN